VKRILFIFLINSFLNFGQEQKNITLLDNWFEDSLITNTSLARFSGCWGFTRNGKEYAAIGSTEGTHFFLINNSKLEPCGFVEGRFNSSLVVHREIKTYGNYAYATCDEGSSSLQIIDLSYLPDSVVKVADIQDANVGKVHNLFIDTANALLYACRVTPIVGGNPLSLVPMRVFSLVDPLNPLPVWEGPGDLPEVHDIYVRNNIGILNCGPDGLRVYDFTNPSTPIYLNNLTFYQDQGYNHQGWLSPDGKTYVFADETSGKRVKKCAVGSDYAIQVQQLFGTNYENNSVPHNIMCSNEFAFIAYYNEGLRIFDIRNGAVEVANFDTYPNSSAFNMNGAWGVYSNYPSGKVIVSDRQNGLFLFQFDQSVLINQASLEFSIYPVPVQESGSCVIRSFKDEITEFSIEIYNGSGEKVSDYSIVNKSYIEFTVPTVSGEYLVKIIYIDYLGNEVFITKKLIIQ